MSIVENPLVGKMKGSMGNFTGYTLYDKINVVRSKAFEIKDAKSVTQLIMRERMSLLGDIYQPFKSIIRLGFPERNVEHTPHNMFFSVNFSTAFETIDNVQSISYPLLLLSKGSLPEVRVLDAVAGVEGITVRYGAKEMSPDVNATDEIIACAMLKTDELLIARQFIGFEDIGTITLKYPSLVAEEVACCYVFVRSGDGKKASNSTYVVV